VVVENNSSHGYYGRPYYGPTGGYLAGAAVGAATGALVGSAIASSNSDNGCQVTDAAGQKHVVPCSDLD
jgi:hypothetical protein